MKSRCYNLNNPSYHRYGGRGISVCDDWLEFVSFRNWALANGYADNLSIDRINNDGNYSPINCQWITLGDNIGKDAGKYGVKPVARLDSEGNISELFKSVSEAARSIGTQAEVISRVCRGQRKTSYGFKWKFIDNERY
jgi:hypothetical protein